MQPSRVAWEVWASAMGSQTLSRIRAGKLARQLWKDAHAQARRRGFWIAVHCLDHVLFWLG